MWAGLQNADLRRPAELLEAALRPASAQGLSLWIFLLDTIAGKLPFLPSPDKAAWKGARERKQWRAERRYIRRVR